MNSAPPHPVAEDCTGSLHEMVVRGFTLFNAGEYWKAHEALEEAWLEEQGQVRHLYRGILQVAVTYYHIQRGNFAGAVKVYARSKRWLDPFPDICRGVDVKGLRRHLEQVMLEVYRLGPDNLAELDPHLLQPIRWSEESK